MEKIEIPGFRKLASKAKEYYLRAFEVHPVYINQAVQYIKYVERCRREKEEVLLPEQWVVGDDFSLPRHLLDLPLAEVCDD